VQGKSDNWSVEFFWRQENQASDLCLSGAGKIWRQINLAGNWCRIILASGKSGVRQRFPQVSPFFDRRRFCIAVFYNGRTADS
jgi:hypothetical protein